MVSNLTLQLKARLLEFLAVIGAEVLKATTNTVTFKLKGRTYIMIVRDKE